MSKEKKVYAAPRLTVHGTVEKITLEDTIPGKDPGAGDGALQWPYGKIADRPEDHMRARSRS